MNQLILFTILLAIAKPTTTLASSYYDQNFYELLEKPYFIDKSEFIKAVFDSQSRKLLLSSPRGFGKTINLQMVQIFLEIDLDDQGVPKEPRNSSAHEIFSKLKINRYPEIIDEFMAKHPVLVLDLEANPGPEPWVKKDIISFMNTKLYDAFAKHSWLLQIPQDVLVDHYGIKKSMIEFMRRLDEKNLQNEDEQDDNKLFKMLANLAGILRSYYRNGVFILVDNYDSFVNNRYKPSGKDVLEYYDFVNGFLQRVFESADEETVAGGILMGTSGLVLSSAQTFLSRTELHPFMGEESKFTKYFGFQEEEVVQLLAKYQCQGKLNEIKSYYNGYKTIYQDLSVYNPSSVIEYLNNLNDNPSRVYWSTSQVDNFLISFINDELLRTVIKNVMNNGTTGFHMAESYTSQNFHLFFELCQSYQYYKTDQGILLWYMYDHGYLSHRIVETQDAMGQILLLDAMGAPNLETRRSLEKLLNCSGQY